MLTEMAPCNKIRPQIVSLSQILLKAGSFAQGSKPKTDVIDWEPFHLHSDYKAKPI
jgi:hypothetical protein